MIPRRKWSGLIIGLVIVYLVVSGNRGLWNLYRLHEEKRNLNEQINQLTAEISHYQIEYQNFSRNSLAMEKQAREELNLVKPGEVVYKFKKTDN